MWSSLLSVLLAFPPMTEPKSLAPHHLGTPLASPTEVAVAAAGGDAWAFWVDDRRDRSFGVETGARSDLWMARVGPDGAPVGALPLPGCLAPPGLTFEKPRAVGTTNGSLLVAWVERRQDGGTQALRVARLGANGLLECPPSAVVDPMTLIDLELGSNGVTALLAWSSASQVDVLELTPRGLRRDGGLEGEFRPGSGRRPAVAGTDGGFLLSWIAADGGVLTRALPGNTEDVGGPGTAVALVARQQTIAQGFTKGTELVTRGLSERGTQNIGPATAIAPATGLLLAPWDADALLSFGWSQPGDTRWAIGSPGQTPQTPQPFVSGYQPRAATGIRGGALAVAQQLDAGTAPLAAFVLANGGSGPVWDGGASLSHSSNQWAPSAIWANGWWMVGHDEASTPDDARPEFHQWRVDPDGTLTEAPWFELLHPRTPQLLQGGGRVGILTVNDGEATISELTRSGNQYSPGATLSNAGEALRFGAIGALDTLQWAAGTGGTFTALHTVAGQAAVPLQHQGTPGRCAVAVDRTFYLPVWREAALELLAFDGSSSELPKYFLVKAFSSPGQRPCVAANGGQLLVTWATGSGIAAAVFDTATRQSAPVSLPGTDSGDVEPVVAAVAGGWVLAWEVRNTDTGRSTIHGAFVTLAGAGDLQVTKLGLDTVHSEGRPALASAPTGQVALAWSTFDEATGQTTTQVRVIGEPPGRPDAGSGSDGGTLLPDAGVAPSDGGSMAPDGGTDPDDLVQFESCGCDAVAPSSLWLLALALLWRREARRGR